MSQSTRITTLKGFDRNKKVTLKQIYNDPLVKLKKFSGAATSLFSGMDKNGNAATGLTENITIPGKPLQKGTRVQMEELLDLAPGTLKNTSKYWETYAIRIGSDPIELDLSDDTSLLKYLFLRGQSIVAEGRDELETNPYAEFILFSEEQEAANRVQGRSSRKKAYILSTELDIETKINVLNVYGIAADASKPNTIDDKIDEKIEEDADKFLQLVKDDLLVYKSLVSKCLGNGILTMDGGTIMHNEVILGLDKDESAKAVSQNPTLRAILSAKLSGDMELLQETLQSKEEAE